MPGKDKSEASDIRSFIAIDISPEVRDSLDKFISELRKVDREVKWVRADSIHLTLKFLGDIRASMLADVKEAIARAALDIAPFKVRVEGTGAFPSLNRPRVFWAGVVEHTGALGKLALLIEDEMKALGFEPEGREFRPHLTLGRARQGGRPSGAVTLISSESKKSFGIFTAGGINLMRSELKPGGAVYTKLESIPLINRGT